MSLLLTSTSDQIILITATAAAIDIDVHVDYVDMNLSTKAITPGRYNGNITTATSTVIVSSPTSGIVRKIKSLRVKNCSATYSCFITLNHTDGSTIIELDKRYLGQNDSILINKELGITPLPSANKPLPSYYGVIAGAYSDGDPNNLLTMCQNNGTVAATPTNITVSIARCALFKLPAALTVNTIRFYGVGSVSNAYKVALYSYSSGLRLTAQLDVNTTANTWGTAGTGLAVSLEADTLYFIACSTIVVGTTAGLLCVAPTIAATTGVIIEPPNGLPGSMNANFGNIYSYNFQFAVTTGALPNPSGPFVAAAAWTGGMPAFWLDSTG